MLYVPVALVVVSVDIPVATFFAETLAFGIAPPCASVMVPDNVAPVTCARSGREISTARHRIDANNRDSTVLEFIDAPSFFVPVLGSLFPLPETPVPLEKHAKLAAIPRERRAN